MKKIVALFLLLTMTVSLASPAYALSEEKEKILQEYASIMQGTWVVSDLDRYVEAYGEDDMIVPREVTFKEDNLSITNDHRVFYGFAYLTEPSWIAKGGEVLLVYNNPDRIGFVFVFEGITEIVYYDRVVN